MLRLKGCDGSNIAGGQDIIGNEEFADVTDMGCRALGESFNIGFRGD
jgi:hypothetical protein